MLAWLVALAGCQSLAPSNERNWTPDQAVLPTAQFEGDEIRIRNIRSNTYYSADDYLLNHYDATVRLSDVETVDFIMIPFSDTPSLAHTMLSFGLADGRRIALSVETRKEVGETYEIWKGFANRYELMYVLGDEEDLVKLRSNFRGEEVYLYPARATPQQVQALFVDVLERANELAESPEFYHAIWNNCTTNIAQHINRISPSRIPYDVGVLLPGYSDRLAYDLGLLAVSEPFALARARAHINERASRVSERGDFSTAIRK